MNETIGVKGGKRDQIRRMIITRNQKKKLEDYQKELDKYELEKLEKKVKQLQRATLIKVAPLAITGSIIKSIVPHQEKKEVQIEKDHETIMNQSKDDVIVTRTNTPIFTNGNVIFYPTIKKQRKIIYNPELHKEENKEEKNTTALAPTDIPTINLNGFPSVQLLKNRKIIEEYEKKLKDIRYELRKLMFEYNALEDESEKLYTKKEAEELLDRLSYIIKKIENLKEKIKVDNLDKYDDNYIYTLIEDYLEEFKDKKVVKEIKDSDLYILISDKIDEIDKKKNSLNKKVESRKEYLKEKEINFEEIKEKYYDYNEFNNMLMRFQFEQDKLLLDLKYKMDRAVNIEEKVERKITALSEQSKKILSMMRTQMFLPGARGTKRTTTMAGLFMYFMKSVLNDEKNKKKYKVVTVADYKYEIEKSIEDINDINTMLNKTKKQVDKMIKKFKEDYSEFMGVIPECDKLLSNLESVKEQLSEREYEIAKIKSEQTKNLAKNEAQVKKIGKYEM